MSQSLAIRPPLGMLKSRGTQVFVRLRDMARAHPREAVAVALVGAAGAIAAVGAIALQGPEPTAPPPAPPPMLVRQIAPDQALKVNAAIPVANGPNPAAKPFVFNGGATMRAQAVQCLASAVYYEAGQESVDGQRAVAQVVLNRVRNSAFPASICGVVYQGSTRATGCQFTFTCDGSLYRQPDAAGWKRARLVANAALSGSVYSPVGNATHYHADYVVPYWASTLLKNAVVGAHIFYRWAGNWGLPGAFGRSYSAHEPNAAFLRSAALEAEAATANQPSTAGLAAAVQDIPGAQAIALKPSMRGDKRVAVRFNLAGREAASKVAHQEYVETFKASDNLRWTLSGQAETSHDQPLGKAAASSSAAGTFGAAGER